MIWISPHLVELCRVFKRGSGGSVFRLNKFMGPVQLSDMED